MRYAKADVQLVGSSGTVHLVVPVALDDEALAWGLQGEQYRRDRAMLFLSSRGALPERIAMWRASVAGPLAMVWFDGGGRVVKLVDVGQGDGRTYAATAVGCLETTSAVVAAAGLRVGDSVFVSSKH